jgi:hypothetical protein
MFAFWKIECLPFYMAEVDFVVLHQDSVRAAIGLGGGND